MKSLLGILTAGVAAVLVAGVAHAEPIKIAIVDMETVMKESPDFKSAETMLKGQLDEVKLEQDELKEEGESLYKEYKEARDQSRNMALSDAAREKQSQKADELEESVKKHERKRREIAGERQKDLTERGLRMRERIVKSLREAIRDYAEKNGITLVLDASGVGMTGIETVVYAQPKLDITEDILKITSVRKPEEGQPEETKPQE